MNIENWISEKTFERELKILVTRMMVRSREKFMVAVPTFNMEIVYYNKVRELITAEQIFDGQIVRTSSATSRIELDNGSSIYVQYYDGAHRISGLIGNRFDLVLMLAAPPFKHLQTDDEMGFIEQVLPITKELKICVS